MERRKLLEFALLLVLFAAIIAITTRQCSTPREVPPPQCCCCVVGAPDAGTPPTYVDAGTPKPPDAGIPPIDGGIVVLPPDGGMFVSGYYAGWFPEMLPHDKIDFSAMTHLVVGRGVPHNNGTVTQGLDADNNRGMQRAKDLSNRAHAANRKAVLMLGGVGDGPAFAAASAPAVRPTFVSNILQFLDTTGMDGVDLDWEEQINHNQWLALVQDLRAARPGLIIILPVFPVNINYPLTAEQKQFFGAVHPYVQQINVMTYGIGMAGPWDGWVTWHTGPLTGEAPNRPTSISSTLAHYAATGIPKSKLGMGIGFYGINYGPPNLAPYEQPRGAYQADDVEWRYSRLFDKYLSAGVYHWDEAAQHGYRSYAGGFNPGQGYSTAGYLTYEDEQSIAAKGAWAKANGYGGTIIWVINYGCTNPSSGANPLLSAVKNAFLK